MNLFINDSTGSVHADLKESSEPRYALVLTHGAGAGMQHPFMQELGSAMTRNAHVLLPNFPYMDAGKKVPGSPQVAIQTITAAIKFLKKQYPSLPVVLSGKSYGGRMCSHQVAENGTDGAMALVYFGFPLHAPGKDSLHRAKHLNAVSVPQLFIQGSNDKLANIGLIKKLQAGLKSSDLMEIKHADHSFKIPKKLGGNPDGFLSSIAQKANNWLLQRLE